MMISGRKVPIQWNHHGSTATLCVRVRDAHAPPTNLRHRASTTTRPTTHNHALREARLLAHVQHLHRRAQVERRRHGGAVLEVAHPQLRPCELPLDVRALRDDLVRVAHHGDQHVQQHDDVDDTVRAEHQHRPEAREALDALQLEGHQVDEAERRPEQRLGRFEEAARMVSEWLVVR